MKASRTLQYAIRALVYVHEANGHTVVGHEMAKALNLSPSFVLRILVSLSRQGLLRSVKGPNGGYTLGKPANEITLLEIVEATQGPVAGHVDGFGDGFGQGLTTKLHNIMDKIADDMNDLFVNVTLADFCESKPKARAKA